MACILLFKKGSNTIAPREKLPRDKPCQNHLCYLTGLGVSMTGRPACHTQSGTRQGEFPYSFCYI